MNRKILMIRPKTAMADSGNYRESRYFTAYQPHTSNNTRNNLIDQQEQFQLPDFWVNKFHQKFAPFGLGFLQCANGTTIGCESCEELWTPKSMHIDMALSGVEIIGNGSGSHHELRKLHSRLGLMVSATQKCGGL